MSDYTQTTFFAPKDVLAPGDPDKLIVGAEFDGEFGPLATAVNSKYDSADLSDLATAQTGTSNTVLMTPLRTTDWGDANAGMVSSLRNQTDQNDDRIIFWDDSASAINQLIVGSGLTISGGNTLQATGGGGGAGDLKIIEANETRVSDTTLSNSTYLAGWSLTAATKYLIRGRLMASTAGASQLKFKLNYSGTTGGGGGNFHAGMNGWEGTSPAGNADGAFTTTIGSTMAITQIAAGENATYDFIAAFETGTAGTLDFQWAQNISIASNASLFMGSYLEVVVIA